MKNGIHASIALEGRKVDYRVICSRGARKLRVRIGPNGVEVVRPASRNEEDVTKFLRANSQWIAGQIERVNGLPCIRKAQQQKRDEILFLGESTRVCVEADPKWHGPNRVSFGSDGILVVRGRSSTPLARSLENWLRQRARAAIETELSQVTKRLKRAPHKVYIMGQRTKWGNCSAMQNLSFNWRLIMAPPFVLQYLVTHEAVHLVVPDHSSRFWLTVQSICPKAERARQWLCANGCKLQVDLHRAFAGNQKMRAS